MRSLMRAAVSGKPVDYVEVRVEETRRTVIRFVGPQLEQIGESLHLGGTARALVRGGWGFVSFNSPERLEESVRQAIEQAEVIARAADAPVRLAPAPVVDVTVPLHADVDPRAIPLGAKKDLLEGYNRMILEQGPPIHSSVVHYFDRHTRLRFANSEGTWVDQERIDVGCRMAAIASEDGPPQQGVVSFGSSATFDVVRGLEPHLWEACERARRLVRARPIAGGRYTVVLDPMLAGVFMHEAFGHLAEGDNFYENAALRDLMRLGSRVGSRLLNVYDTGETRGARGALVYDDEGVRARRTDLIVEGVIAGHLHSRETAGRMGEPATGNARALDYRFMPIPRMRNTCIAPGDARFEDLLQGVELGVYCKSAYGGQTAHELFTFTAGEAFMIRDGKLAEPVRDVTLSGNVFTTLAAVDAVGADFTPHDSAGGCGKKGQMPLPVSHWAPHLRIRDVVIGGRGA